MKRTLAILILLCATAAADEAKRDVPDYDGRGDPPTTAGDVLIWVPRVAVSPLYLVSEYVIRKPMEVLVETVERHQWAQRVIDYFNGPVGIVPTALVDTGMSPTLGFYFF